MSLLPLVGDPSDFQPLNQHFGPDPDDDDHNPHSCGGDFLEPRVSRRRRRRRRGRGRSGRKMMMMTSPCTRGSQVPKRDKSLSPDKNKFQVSLDVQQFAPEEIRVKASGRTVTVEGKHDEEKEDELGFTSRQFVHEFCLPEGHDINLVQSKLSSDGVLVITAPKVQKDKETEREIPIFLTGQPS